MEPMKKIIILCIAGFASVGVAGDCIIDPSKVVGNITSEPIFMPHEDNVREIASKIKGGKEEHSVRAPDQYLDVVKNIPFSEPKLNRTWLEYRILKED
jgi:hypothetical protein